MRSPGGLLLRVLAAVVLLAMLADTSASAMGVSTVAAAGISDSRDIAVSAHREDDVIVLDVDMLVDASPADAWAVLTDYDHMACFVSSLTTSRVIERGEGKLEVEQVSHFGIGLFRFDFDNVREIELDPPREIRSTLVRGDLRASSFATRLLPEGPKTRIINHGRFIPDHWIPPVIGLAVLEAETRKQFGELRAEIVRRIHWHAGVFATCYRHAS